MKVPPCRSRSETRAEEASQRRPWVSSMILENDSGHVTDSLEVNRMTVHRMRCEDRFTREVNRGKSNTRDRLGHVSDTRSYMCTTKQLLGNRLPMQHCET